MSDSSSQTESSPQSISLTRFNILNFEMDGIEKSIHDYQYTIQQLIEEASYLTAKPKQERLSNGRLGRCSEDVVVGREVAALDRTKATVVKQLANTKKKSVNKNRKRSSRKRGQARRETRA